jgi:DNA-binding transcriptional MerR regulator
MSAVPDRPPGAGATLIEQGMPVDEVRAVLDAADPMTVRRHLELHRERLAEQLDAQRRAVDRLERVLLERPPR